MGEMPRQRVAGWRKKWRIGRPAGKSGGGLGGSGRYALSRLQIAGGQGNL